MNAYNRFFERSAVDGIAHRKKQSRFTSQLCDILVDSATDSFYIAIECKSVKTSSTNKLYFSQHFSQTDEGHQVDRITEFVAQSGRRGFLAVELKRGIGVPRQLFMLPWSVVRTAFEAGETGIHLDQIQGYPQVPRESSEYSVTSLVEDGEFLP